MIRLRRLGRDAEGAAAVEFAMVAPVLLLTVMGIFDMGYSMYTTSILQGAIQKAARDSSIEGAPLSAAAIDARVTRMVRHIVPGAVLAFGRKSYSSFSDVGRPEDFTDTDRDGICNNGEPFEDVNGNGTWDADRGKGGFGGARDAVLYTVTVTFDRPFPLARMLGQSQTMQLSTQTVLRNQPFGMPGAPVTTIGNCP